MKSQEFYYLRILINVLPRMDVIYEVYLVSCLGRVCEAKQKWYDWIRLIFKTMEDSFQTF